MDYNSKYPGDLLDELLDKVNRSTADEDLLVVGTYFNNRRCSFNVTSSGVYETIKAFFKEGDSIIISVPQLICLKKITAIYVVYTDDTETAFYDVESGDIKGVKLAKDLKEIKIYAIADEIITDGEDSILIGRNSEDKAVLQKNIASQIATINANATKISALESALRVDVKKSFSENDLIQTSTVRVNYRQNVNSTFIVGSIETREIDVAVEYLALDGSIIYDSGWTRSLRIDTRGYSNIHELNIVYRNAEASGITVADVIEYTIFMELGIYGYPASGTEITGEGNTEYYGKKININIFEEKKYCKNTHLYTILNREDYPLLSSVQSLAIHNGIGIIPRDGSSFVVMDMNSGELINQGTLPESHHNNALQFSNTYYNENDRFPLMLMSTGNYLDLNNKVMVLRMDNNYNVTLIKNITTTLPSVQYNGSFVADFSTNRLFLYTLTNGLYYQYENNEFVLYEFNLPELLTGGDVVLTKDDIIKQTVMPMFDTQDAVAYAGKLWIPSNGIKQIDGFETAPYGMNANAITVINPNTCVIESIINGVQGLEPQGIDFYNGYMYVIYKNSGVTEVGYTAFRVYRYQLY